MKKWNEYGTGIVCFTWEQAKRIRLWMHMLLYSTLGFFFWMVPHLENLCDRDIKNASGTSSSFFLAGVETNSFSPIEILRPLFLQLKCAWDFEREELEFFCLLMQLCVILALLQKGNMECSFLQTLLSFFIWGREPRETLGGKKN